MDQEDYTVMVSMKTYGGKFVRALGNAISLADEQNLARLKAAFPELWKSYAEMAELQAKRKGEQNG